MSSRRQGFTLVEIMVVVVIIGLLVTLAVPSFKRIHSSSRFVTFMNDARIFAAGVDLLALETGQPPVDSNTGQMSPELRDYVNEYFFTKESPIGGKWDVEYMDSGITLGVGVVDFTVSQARLAKLDAKFDDGDLDAGKYQLINSTRYYLVLEE